MLSNGHEFIKASTRGNATAFLQQFVPGGSANIETEPYARTYKYISPTKHLGFRAGIGVDNERSTDDNTGTKSITTSADVRLGFEMQHCLKCRFWYYWGIDGVLQYLNNQTTVEDGFDKVEFITTTNGFGGALIGGIHFNIYKRLALNTEFGFRGLYTEDISKTKSEQLPFLRMRSDQRT